MASIKLVSEDEAEDSVKVVYEDIKRELGIDFVPNLYKVMATNPGYLEANWNKVKAVMVAQGCSTALRKRSSRLPCLLSKGVTTDCKYTLLRCRS